MNHHVKKIYDSVIVAVLITVFPAIAIVFFYGTAYAFNYILPQWFKAWPFSPETLTDKYLGGILTLCFGLVLIAFKEIIDEYRKSRVTHEHGPRRTWKNE